MLELSISKQTFVRIISFAIAIIAALAVYAGINYSNANSARRQLEYSYMRAAEDLSLSLDNIKNTLNKGIYANSANLADELAEKLRVTLAKHPALSADSAFAALPASEEKLKNAICTYNAGADRLSGKLTRFPSKTVAGRMCLENRQRFSL